MKAYIYIIDDPSEHSLGLYVEKTCFPSRRFSDHLRLIYLSANTRKNSWIKNLLQRNVKPRFTIIEECDPDSWEESESFWISYFKSIGFELLNGTSGGDGLHEPSLDIRLKMRKSHQGQIPWNKGLTKDKDSRLKGNTKPVSEEFREKMRRSHLGRKFSEEHKENIRKATTGSKNPFFGKKHTEQVKERNRQAHMRKKDA